VRRRSGGDTDVVVSTLLSPARQRKAVRVGLRAARPTDRRAVLPVPLLGVLALAWASVRAIGKAMRVHPAALVAATAAVTAVTAAAVVIAVVPHQHGAAGGGHPSVGALPPLPRQAAGGPTRGAQPTAGPHSSEPSAPSVVPVADQSAPEASRPSPAPAEPEPSPAQSALSTAAPQPTPSPSAAGGGRICLELLGVRVCL
jgi:hypothetical protein